MMKKLSIACIALLSLASAHAQPVLWGVTAYGGSNNNGAIIKYDAASNNLSAVKTFGSAEFGCSGSFTKTANGKLYGMAQLGGDYGSGAIFSFDPSTGIYNRVADFNGDNGAMPGRASLCIATDGKLYGVTFYGGNSNCGVIFSFDPEINKIVKLFDFDSSKGSNPSGIMVAGDGKLYGTTTYGGSNNVGVIFSFDPFSHNFSKLMDFNISDGAKPNGALIESSGLLYGTTSEGGANGWGVLFAFEPVSQWYHKWVDMDGYNGAYPNGDMVEYNGRLYGLTNNGGVNDMGVIFSFDLSTYTYSKHLDFYDNGAAFPGGNLIKADDGKLYGMTQMGGLGNINIPWQGFGVIFSFDPVTNAYANLWKFDDTSGANPVGGLAQANNGKLYGMTSRGGVTQAGVIFSFDRIANHFAKWVDMGVINSGRSPVAGLVKHSNGKFYGLASSGGAHNRGTIFSYNPVTGAYEKLLDFDGSNGDSPASGLTNGSDGKLYGVTPSGGKGGASGYGVLFSFAPGTNTFTKLFEFDRPTGNYPLGGLLQAKNGKLYGMTTDGGSHLAGVIYSFDPTTNTYNKLWDFDIANGANPYGALMQAHNGKLYGLTESGGTSFRGVLFSFDPAANVFSKLQDFDDNNGKDPHGGLTEAPDGRLYGMTFYGGAANSGVLFSFDPLLNKLDVVHNFDGLNGATPYGNLNLASDGKLYGMTSAGGSKGKGVLFSYNWMNNTFTPLQNFDGANGAAPLWGATLLEAAECTQPIVINNVSSLDSDVLVNMPLTLKVSFTAGNIANAAINWGDGTTTQTVYGPSNPFTISHVYNKPNIYQAAVTLMDRCGRSGKPYVFQHAIVYDPGTGFLTGGGWINSPLIPALPLMKAGGKATFGLNAKYERHDPVPGGNTAFDFHAGNMNFKSRSYNWLVISDAKAWLRGNGTINGKGKFNFLLGAVDGDLSKPARPDLLRMQIWDDHGATVYDNQYGAASDTAVATPIAKGDIVIHKPKKEKQEITAIAIKELAAFTRLSAVVLPNPSHTGFTLIVNGVSGQPAKITITDELGKTIETKDKLPSTDAVRIGDNYLPGIYFVQIRQGGESVSLKLIKQAN